MKREMNFVLIISTMFLCITAYSQEVGKVFNHEFYLQDERWLIDYEYIYPVHNSEFYVPRDKDYKLVHNWEFDNEEEFLADWERLDGIRGNQLMYFRDNDMNYGFETEEENGYLHLKTYYHNPRIIFYETWPRPYSLSYEYSTAECTTKDSILYGYFEARMKLPKFKGAHAAFWLFSEGYNGNALEIDIMEASSGNVLDTRRHVFTTNFSEYDHNSGNLHKRGFVYQNDFYNSLSDAFHIYAVEWTPFDLRYYIDNQLIRVYQIPSKYEIFPCFVRLCVEVDHWNPPHDHVFDPLIIDYVRVYQKNSLVPGSQRPEIEYDDKIIQAEVWVTASVKDPSPTKNYYWETDGNCTYYIDGNNDIHFYLDRNGSRSTIIGLTSLDFTGPSETNPWKEQVLFTDMLPTYFKLLDYKTYCNEEGKGRVTVKSLDLSKYGVDSTIFKVFLTNENGDIVGDPIEILELPDNTEGVFWLNPKTQYWIENNAEWPDEGTKTMGRLLVYPVMDPSFSPRLYMDDVGGNQTKFVDGKCVNENQINKWFLYRTDRDNSFLDFLEIYEAPGNKTFCFEL